MVEQNIQGSIVIGGAEERQKLINTINEGIKLKETISSANESIKNIINNSYENYQGLTSDPIKKGKFSKQFKLIIEEALNAKATEVNSETQEAIESFELIKNKLI